MEFILFSRTRGIPSLEAMNADPVMIDISTSDHIQVTGNIDIVVTESKARNLGRCPISSRLFYYKGRFRSGTNEGSWIEASIFAYDSPMATTFLDQCTRFHHPYVMRPLGHGMGVGAYSSYMFVALPSFSQTLDDWVKQGSPAAAKGRFTEQFIDIVSQMVKGITALHDNGFHCPNLQGKHVALKVENERSTVQIWNFRALDPAQVAAKDKSWRSLASLLEEAARNNGAGAKGSLELNDLFAKIRSGRLKGLDILKHSALLTVQQKFDNVIALNSHVLLHCQPLPVVALNQPSNVSTELAQNQTSTVPTELALNQPSTVSTESYSLVDYLDVEEKDITQWPQFIWKHRNVIPNTVRKLLDELRDMIEHENEYIPPELTTEQIMKGGLETDLEQHVRLTCPKGFLKIQQWAVDPSVKLPK